jgi:hypothetical protein
MDDREIIEALVVGGAVGGFGTRLHIERDCLLFDGWWQAAFRVAPQTFALRDEAPPADTSVLDDVARQLRAHGLKEVPADPALLIAITYTAIDLGSADWTLWSTDVATAGADLAARAGLDAFFSDSPGVGTGPSDFAAGMGGLRRLAGLRPLVILAVGIDAAAVQTMAAALGNCHFESRALGQISPDACGTLTPNLALVDATSAEGRDFAGALRASVGGRDLLLVAVSGVGDLPGVDAILDPASDPAEWAEHLRNLLP